MTKKILMQDNKLMDDVGQYGIWEMVIFPGCICVLDLAHMIINSYYKVYMWKFLAGGFKIPTQLTDTQMQNQPWEETPPYYFVISCHSVWAAKVAAGSSL